MVAQLLRAMMMRSSTPPPNGFRALDDAFFESYRVPEADGGRRSLRLATGLLATGVQVVCTMDRVPNSCTLSLTREGGLAGSGSADRDGFILLSGLSSSTKGCSLVPLADVATMVCEPRGPRGVITCGVRKRKGGGNKGFSFVCLDRQGVPGASLTKAVALVLSLNACVRLEINQVARGVSCAFEIDDVWYPATSPGGGCDEGPARCRGQFASILEPAGLSGHYEDDFERSGLEYQDLAVVNRDDLEELVGITNRLHQIKIMTQIRLRFHAAAGTGLERGGGSRDASSLCRSCGDALRSGLAYKADKPRDCGQRGEIGRGDYVVSGSAGHRFPVCSDGGAGGAVVVEEAGGAQRGRLRQVRRQPQHERQPQPHQQHPREDGLVGAISLL